MLIVGSGNLVHNLHAYAWGGHPRDPYDWALGFEERAKDLILARKFAPLVAYEELGSDAALSIPTPEHYLPLLYVLRLVRLRRRPASDQRRRRRIDFDLDSEDWVTTQNPER